MSKTDTYTVVVGEAPSGRAPPCDSYGDVNMDGFVTISDAMMVQNFITGSIDLTPEQQRRADVNGDGSVSIADAQWIVNYVVGDVDTFPVCTGLHKS